MELIRQINKGFMQVRRRTMQVGEKNSQVKETFWQVREFLIKTQIDLYKQSYPPTGSSAFLLFF
jgi:hypothetical protein